MHVNIRLLKVREAIVKLGDHINELSLVDGQDCDAATWYREMINSFNEYRELKLVEDCLSIIHNELLDEIADNEVDYIKL